MNTIIKCARPEIDFTDKDIHFFAAMRNQPISYEVAVPGEGEIRWDVRPFGEVTVIGDIEEALPHILAWVKPDVIVAEGWTWRDAIAETMSLGGSVNFDQLPEDILYATLPEVEEEDDLPRGWTASAMVDAAVCDGLQRRTGIDKW